MSVENQKLLDQANQAKASFKYGVITKNEAEIRIYPFMKKFNEVSIREAKKAGVKARLFNMTSFLR